MRKVDWTADFRPKVVAWTAAFMAERCGSAAVYLALILPILAGTAMLAIDGSRVFHLQTALQKGADALALAGAAELDRKPDSITRANAAIANMVVNKDKFGPGAAASITTSSIRYLSSLPTSDASAVAGSNVTTDPTLAHYVEVTVTPVTSTSIFPVTFADGRQTATGRAKAVAGFDAVACQFTPMFICNPWEGTGTDLFAAVQDPTLRRRQIKLQSGAGGTAQYFPGNYGWLDSPTLGNGATALRDALASVSPSACFIQNGVSTKTGNVANADDALNTRFDLWGGPYNNANNNSGYRPALNVRKGYVAGKGKNGACSPTNTNTNPIYPAASNDNQLGRDSAYPYAGGRMGNGTWDFVSYWANNFGGAAPNGWSNVSANLPPRYDVYRYEIDNAKTSLAAVKGNAKGEVGTPACYSGGGVSDTPDRRVLYAAIIDCTNLSVHGNSGGPLAVKAFGKFFLTEPVTGGNIYSELIGVVEPGSDPTSVVKDMVQLYR